MTKARKGDLVVVATTHHDFYIGEGLRPTRTSFELATVNGVNREGLVTSVVIPWGHVKRVKGETVYVVGNDKIVDVKAAFAAARAHHYPGHECQPKPFDSIDETREFVRPFLRPNNYNPRGVAA